MPSHELLKSLPSDQLWAFLKWLAFGPGRYVGIRILPGDLSGKGSDRIRQLATDIARASKQPDDATLGIAFPEVDLLIEDAALVTAIAEYIAGRQIGFFRGAADFEPRHAYEIQDVALRRIMAR